MMTINEAIRVFGDGHFVLCKGKRALGNSKYSGAQAQVHVDAGGQIGLWIPNGFIAIDIDDMEQAQILERILPNAMRSKTSKGMHFFFTTNKEQKQRVKAHTPIGLMVDTRTANKGYVVLPINDEKRDYIPGEVYELPYWIDPLNLPSKSATYIIPNAGGGSGRNDSMLKQLMRLRSFFDQEQTTEIARIINWFVFKERLDDSELDYLISQANKYQPLDRAENNFLLYNANGSAIGVNHIAIVQYMIQEYRMFVLGADNLYIYHGGVYVSNPSYVRDIILKLIDNPKYQKQAEVMGVYRLLLDRVELQIQDSDTNVDKLKINFLNGMFDIEEQVLYPHSPDYLSTIQIPHNYVENTLSIEDIQFYDFLKKTKMAHDDIVMLLKYMAYCMTINNHLKAFMVLIGQTNTGKSTLINIFSRLVGYQNISNLSIHQLSQRFYPSEIKDKLLNANADNGSMELTSIETLKKITGNDQIMWERKGQDPFFFTPTSRLLFSFNELPLQVEERSNAFWQRIRILEMNHQIELTQTYYTELVSDSSISAIIPILCRIAKGMVEIPQSEKSRRLAQSLREESDSVGGFINNMLDYTKDTHDFLTKDELYMSYSMYCINSDLKPFAKKALYKALENMGLREVRRGEQRRYGYYGIRWANRE